MRERFTNSRSQTLNVLTFFSLCFVLLLAGCQGGGRPEVVVYTSQDQVFAEPILREFTRESGIEARAVYDNEAVKTVGLTQRLMAERSHPQCDVFWNNEELRTRQLAAAGVFRAPNGWRAFGYRSRRLVVRTDEDVPDDLTFHDLTNAVWRGRVALAYPLFGTTATHFLVLRQLWGRTNWEAWCRGLERNRPFLVDGNSVVVSQVGHGEAAIGMTDSDDVAAGRREGLAVRELPMTTETLLIPNTVGLVRNSPHPEAADKLADYLQRSDVVAQLVKAGALEGASMATVKAQTLQPDWKAILGDLDTATETLKRIFLR